MQWINTAIESVAIGEGINEYEGASIVIVSGSPNQPLESSRASIDPIGLVDVESLSR